jgi:methyl-accepting chemotaxis protein
MALVDRFGLGAKLLLAPALLVALMLVQGTLAWDSLRQQAHEIETVSQVRMARSEEVKGLAERFRIAHGEIYQLIAWINAEFAAKRVEPLEKQLRSRLTELARDLERLQAQPDLAPEQAESLKATTQAVAAYLKSADTIIKLTSDDLSMATLMTQKLEQAFAVAVKGLDELRSQEQAHTVAAFERVTADARQLMATLVLGLGISLVVAGGVTWALRRRLLASLRRLRESGESLARGDLTRQAAIHGRDELAQIAGSMNQALSEVGGLIHGIQRSAADVQQGSDSIAEGNQALSQQIDAQASALQQTAAMLQGVTTGLGETARQVGQIDGLARDTGERAKAGAADALAARETMDSIRQSSARIAEITSVVDGLAFQTNILALNAAVEAARAGEHGRGFAVVAAEVRSLAQRSAAASREIKSLILDSVERVQSGAERVAAAESSIGEIGRQIQSLSGELSGIASTVSAQADGIAQINLAVAKIDESSQRNSSLVERSSAAASDLRAQAQLLRESTARFRVAEPGSAQALA